MSSRNTDSTNGILQRFKFWMNEPINTKRFVGMFIIVSVFIALVNWHIIPTADEIFPELYEELGK